MAHHLARQVKHEPAHGSHFMALSAIPPEPNIERGKRLWTMTQQLALMFVFDDDQPERFLRLSYAVHCLGQRAIEVMFPGRSGNPGDGLLHLSVQTSADSEGFNGMDAHFPIRAKDRMFEFAVFLPKLQHFLHARIRA